MIRTPRERLAAIPAGARDLNNLGMIIADKSVNGSLLSFIQWGRHSLDLEPLPGSIYTAASRINERGMVIGLNDLIRADDPSRPYVRFVQAKMINNRGQIVVDGVDSRKPAARLSFLLTPSGHR